MRQRALVHLAPLFNAANCAGVVGLLRPPPRSLSPPPPPSLSLRSPSRAGTWAGAGAGLVGGLALGVANHFSPTFRAALGPSGRAAMVVLPALGVVFLEVEWKINECARRRSTSPGAPRGRAGEAEPDDILPRRSG